MNGSGRLSMTTNDVEGLVGRLRKTGGIKICEEAAAALTAQAEAIAEARELFERSRALVIMDDTWLKDRRAWLTAHSSETP